MPEAVTPPNPAGGGAEGGGARHYPGSSSAPGMSKGSGDNPDPTLLTIDSIRREIAMLESLFDTRLESSRELVSSQFRRVDDLMKAAEEQRRENKADTKESVDVALATQQTAIDKMGKTISDQLDSLRSNFETEIRSIRGTLADLKDRMTQAESIKQGASSQRSERREVNASTVALVGLVVTIVLATITILGFMATSGGA